MDEIVYQSGAAECGLACIAMIAARHGRRITLPQLRVRFPPSPRGTNAQRLKAIAEQIGLGSQCVTIELSALTSANLPCILHWNERHFVVLAKKNGGLLTIHDPAVGAFSIDIEEASKHFSGSAILLQPMPATSLDESTPPPNIFQMVRAVPNAMKALGTILSLSTLLQVFALISPLLLQITIDKVVPAGDLSLLAILIAAFSALLIIQMATAVLRSLLTLSVARRINTSWLTETFSHLSSLPLKFFEVRHMGDVISRMHSVLALQRTVTASAIDGTIDAVMAVIVLAMMLTYSVKLSLISVSAVALYFLARAAMHNRIKTATENHLNASAKQQSYLLESVRGMQAIKMAAIEDYRSSRYADLVRLTASKEAALSKFNVAIGASSQSIFGIERIIVVCAAAVLIIDASITIGMLVAYLAYKEQFSQRINNFVDKFLELKMTALHLERLHDIRGTAPESGIGDGTPGSVLSFSLEAINLGFRYDPDGPWMFRGLNFSIFDGDWAAIVGESGAGKTTLLKILAGLLEPTEGRIMLNGMDISKLNRQSYRRLIGAVMQDDHLFAGSVADNIALGEETRDSKMIKAAAKAACIHEDIELMPMKYQTPIGDMGSTLSGGQRQRLTIARALYKRPKCLILDEATSHLDARLENQILSSLSGIKVTKISVSHRGDFEKHATRIIPVGASIRRRAIDVAATSL